MNRNIFFVMPFILISLVLGTYGGLVRIGWSLPVNFSAAQHGVILVGSFLGTLILLERIVIFRNRLLYLFPALSGLSILPLLSGQFQAALLMLMIPALSLVIIYIYLYLLHREIYILIMMAGALALFGGYIVLLISRLYPMAVTYWMAFLLLTIIGERLELTKFLPKSKVKSTWLLFSILFFFSGWIINFHGWGEKISGMALVLMAVWLAKFDIAFKSIKMPGIHRYIASNLIAGYAWLFITGLIMISDLELKFSYDAVLHSFFLGFTFSMILAHGPIILPGVAGFNIRPYHPVLYTWGILLQVSLTLRVVADLMEWPVLRTNMGFLNMMAVLGFFINVFILIRLKRGKPVTG